MMRHITFSILLFVLCIASASAQPAARRQSQTKQNTTQTRNAPRGASYREFPTAPAMPENVDWKRDIYRALDLQREHNAALYFPSTPQEGRENLFCYLFKLLLRKQIKAYDYKLSGNENFSADNEVTAKELMDRYHIFYETKDGRIRVNDADIPGDEVKMYYVKESVFYDQTTATFHTQVTALCPVLMRGDSEFGGTEARYPMFWVKFSDVAPLLGKFMVMGSSYNNAATLSADDYFTTTQYDGDIYKTVNLQDRLLSESINPFASEEEQQKAIREEQNRIEKQLTELHDYVWGKDSVQSEKANNGVAEKKEEAKETEAPAQEKVTKPARRAKTSTTTRRSGVSKVTKTPKQKTSSSKSSGATYSVRKERH